MRIRTSFVSNSSTASFIVDLNTYESVFDLAKKILRIILQDRYRELNLDKQDKKEFRLYLKRINSLESKKIDKDTPIIIPTYNFNTEIVKRDDGYYVNSDHVLPWESFLTTIRLDFDHEYNFFSEGYCFYILEFDVLGKIIDDPENKICKDHHYPYNNVELRSGKRVCLECERQKGNLKEFRISDVENPIDSFTNRSKNESNAEYATILNEFKYTLSKIRNLEEKHWMELYSWGIKIFSREIEKNQPDFEYISEVASYLIELGVERNNWRISVLGKNLLASVLSFSDDIKDIEYALSLFEEIKFKMQNKMPELYSTKYHKKAVNKKLKLLKDKKNEN